MTCKTAEKMIPAFLKKELNYKTLMKFLNHVEHCESCKEELNIQFLVMVGTEILETGSSFDLTKELNKLMVETKRNMRRKRALTIGLYSFELCAIAAVIGILMVVIF